MLVCCGNSKNQLQINHPGVGGESKEHHVVHFENTYYNTLYTLISLLPYSLVVERVALREF